MQLTFGAQKPSIWVRPGGPCSAHHLPPAPATHWRRTVVVRHASGVAPGIYHYGPLDHTLVLLKNGARSTIERHLPGQSWYGNASVLVLITAVFARTDWKYPSARAYRDVLLEAGHFCQTFCLVATALGLAPFCTGALADSTIERDLGLDGVTESVIYACGVGTRPRTWTGPRGRTPRTFPPSFPRPPRRGSDLGGHDAA